MATRRANAASQEFLPADEVERQAQRMAGAMLASLPEEPEPEPEERDPDETALENVLAELGSSGADAKVNVYQIDEKKNRAFVGSFLPQDFSIESLQAQYGAGDYAVEVRKDKKWLKKTMVKIAAPKTSAMALQAVNPAPDTGKIIETMQNGFKEMGSMFANALATLATNQPKPKTTMEMLQEMQLMREIMGGNSPAAPSGPDPMQLFEMATQIAEKINPRESEPGTGEIILNAIKQFGPVLAQGAMQKQVPQTGPQLPAPVAPSTPGVTVPDAPQISPENSNMDFARRMYLNLLISNAEHNNDPGTYANLMLDIAGEEQAVAFANDPQWFEKLCAEEPRAANHRPWFEELRAMVLELTKPETPDNNTGNEEKPVTS